MNISFARMMSIFVLALSDVLMVFTSFYLASLAVYDNFAIGSSVGMSLITVVTMLMVYLFGGYALRRQLSYLHIPGQMVIAVLLALIVVATIGYITKLTETDLNYWRAQLLTGMLFTFIWFVLSRTIIRLLLQKLTLEPVWGVLGSREHGQQIENDMHAVYGEGKFRFIEKLQGKVDHAMDALIVLPDSHIEDSAHDLLDIRFAGVRVFNVAEFYERYLFKVPLRFLDRTWFATTAEFGLLHHETAMRVKRMVDIISALLLLTLCAPLMALTALAVFLGDRGDVFYTQVRVGLVDKHFKLYKFRTMIPNAEQQGQAQWAQENDNRITAVGRFLRLTRLDELPQIINVLRGEMSFIGPRPERPEFVEKLEKNIPYYQYRHAVKPGITGWAQVMYRYGASEDDSMKKLEYDLYYIRNYSLMLDLFIVLRTIRVVLFGMGR